jgi:hypothetical protein
MMKNVYFSTNWKPIAVASVISVTVTLLFSGCFSNARIAKWEAEAAQVGLVPVNVTAFSAIPTISNEVTPLEGIWQNIDGKTTTEYTFSGNRFTHIAGNKGKPNGGFRGIFKLAGDTIEMYRLETWNPNKESVWNILPTGVFVIPMPNWTLTGDTSFSKIESPTLIIQLPPSILDIAASNGLTIDENDALLSVRRITETGLKTRIGEPEEWEIYVDGSQAGIVRKHQTLSLVVPNGTHKIYIAFHRDTGNITRKSHELTFYAWSNHISLATYLEGAGGQELVLALD